MFCPITPGPVASKNCRKNQRFRVRLRLFVPPCTSLFFQFRVQSGVQIRVVLGAVLTCQSERRPTAGLPITVERHKPNRYRRNVEKVTRGATDAGLMQARAGTTRRFKNALGSGRRKIESRTPVPEQQRVARGRGGGAVQSDTRRRNQTARSAISFARARSNDAPRCTVAADEPRGARNTVETRQGDKPHRLRVVTTGAAFYRFPLKYKPSIDALDSRATTGRLTGCGGGQIATTTATWPNSQRRHQTPTRSGQGARDLAVDRAPSFKTYLSTLVSPCSPVQGFVLPLVE